jgi:hypothetical protein
MSNPTSTDPTPTHPIDQSVSQARHDACALAMDASTLDRTLGEQHAIPTGYRTVRLSGLPHR